jgi:hypothetical protein
MGSCIFTCTAASPDAGTNGCPPQLSCVAVGGAFGCE